MLSHNLLSGLLDLPLVCLLPALLLSAQMARLDANLPHVLVYDVLELEGHRLLVCFVNAVNLLVLNGSQPLERLSMELDEAFALVVLRVFVDEGDNALVEDFDLINQLHGV